MFRSGLLLTLLPVVLAGACALDDADAPDDIEAANTVPWKQESKWPYAIETPSFIVHYQKPGDATMAQTVLAFVDSAWQSQIVQQGSRAPLDDHGAAGPDGRFDVYLQLGIDSLYVASVAAEPATPYDDYSTAMVLDPWGQYGGPELEANIYHELRHASQAVDDWWEHIHIFEAEATLWETVRFGPERLSFVWADYQAHPEWTPFKDDRYTTWFMYGGAMFLLYLHQNEFGNSLAFSNEMWLRSRNPAGTNEPDFADALDQILRSRGTSLFDELLGFARARWYTGSRANNQIFASGAAYAEVATRAHTRAANAQRTTFLANPQLLGTIYTVIQAAPTDGTTLRVSLSNIDAKARPIVQLVGQNNTDRILDLSTGSATIPLASGRATLAVTMLPSNNQFDPDSVGTQAYKATVNIDR